MKNPILEYWNLIFTNQVVVCKKVYSVMKKLSSDVLQVDGDFFYDEKKAFHAIDFIELFCKHSKGKWGGKPVILDLWQKAIIASAFGFVDKTGNRKYREIFLVVARKNGKSTFASAIGLYLQVADGEAGAEIYAVATKRDQAKLVWDEAKRMVMKSPFLLKKVKPLTNSLTAEFNNSIFKPLSSDSNSLDGLNVHGAIMDEIHAWTDQNLYDVVVDGTSARDNPMVWLITTAGTVRESVFDRKYEEAEKILNGYEDDEGYKDERVLPFIYELDSKSEWTNPDCWQKANPALHTIKNIDQIITKVNKAKHDTRQVKNLICKDFNIRETSGEAWLSFSELNNTSIFDLGKLKPKYGIGGVDLSKTTDLTAAKAIFMVPDDPVVYVLSMYWLPAELLEFRVREDQIPYDLWYERGLLRLSDGNQVHPKNVTQWFIELQEQYELYLPWIGYDAWSASYWVEEMEGYFGKNAMEKVHQGKFTLSRPMEILGADLRKKQVNYNNNPIDKWCLSNTSVEYDKNGNMQPTKGKNQRKRIDGLAALLNCYVVLERHRNDYLNLMW